MTPTKAENICAAFNRELAKDREEIGAIARRVDRHDKALAHRGDDHALLRRHHNALEMDHLVTSVGLNHFRTMRFLDRLRWMLLGRL